MSKLFFGTEGRYVLGEMVYISPEERERLLGLLKARIEAGIADCAEEANPGGILDDVLDSEGYAELVYRLRDDNLCTDSIWIKGALYVAVHPHPWTEVVEDMIDEGDDYARMRGGAEWGED